MLKFIKNLVFLWNSLELINKAIAYRMMAGFDLPGKEFDWYGRRISIIFLLNNQLEKFRKLLCNPVSIVRYFEFPFVFNAVDWKKTDIFLDISSPQLFFLYILNKFSHIKSEILNPDVNDLNESAKYLEILGFLKRVNLVSYDATHLPYTDNSFDVITSISVIEHISEDGDSLAIKEMWRILKPGGKIVLTVPCAKQYYEEWIDKDAYNLGVTSKNGKYFFSRYYDENALKNRLFESINTEPVSIKIFGEKENGIYSNYVKKWINLGLLETIKDPLHIVRDYTFFKEINLLSGMGVCMLVFKKELINV